ncbi:hypothetical protein ES708_30233 [subsurface metagenome]
MKKTIVIDYERDLRTILLLAARNKIKKSITTNVYAEGYFTGMGEALQIAALQLLSRLVWLCPERYTFKDYSSREEYIQLRIKRFVKEKIK